MYSRLLTFGDLIPLTINCNVNKLILQTKNFEYKQYNPRKDIPRFGLSITSLKGELDGIDLDSLPEYNKENNTNINLKKKSWKRIFSKA